MRRAIYAIIFALGLSLVSSAVGAADLNSFTITNYDIDMKLSRDSNKRSVLQTRERITADFPQNSQNHGIERYIPKKYQNHDVNLKVDSVKDGSGDNLEWTTYNSGSYTVLRIGNANRYVRGAHTYDISYSQHDVTAFFDNTNRQEFYWDTNGTEWRVPISNLSVTLDISDDLLPELSTDVLCKFGKFGSDQDCAVQTDNGRFTAGESGLAPGDNITLIAGFGQETFAEYQPSLFKTLQDIWLFVLTPISIVVMIVLVAWYILRSLRVSKRFKEQKPTTVEFIPPRNSSVYLSSVMLGLEPRSFGAQLVDFAVRHYIKIYEVTKKTVFTKAVYEFEIVKPITDLRDEEIEFFDDVFAGQTAVGSRVSTKDLSRDTRIGLRLQDNSRKAKTLMRLKYDLQYVDKGERRWFSTQGRWLLIVGLLTLNPPLLLACAIAYGIASTLWVYTDDGLALHRYLQGLREYISAVEAEQFRLYQSPEGAEKMTVDPSDPKQMVKLYERNLPYAILFGQEKEWNKRLGNYYEASNQQPDWFTGVALGTFSAAAFTSAISDMTTSISSVGSSSSSTGGSSGGGFSGGGGGGGGGGGW